MPLEGVNCLDCVYFRNTYESCNSYYCGFYGVLSSRRPSIIIEKSNGYPCNMFESKKIKKKIEERKSVEDIVEINRK